MVLLKTLTVIVEAAEPGLAGLSRHREKRGRPTGRHADRQAALMIIETSTRPLI